MPTCRECGRWLAPNPGGEESHYRWHRRQDKALGTVRVPEQATRVCQGCAGHGSIGAFRCPVCKGAGTVPMGGAP